MCGIGPGLGDSIQVPFGRFAAISRSWINPFFWRLFMTETCSGTVVREEEQRFRCASLGEALHGGHGQRRRSCEGMSEQLVVDFDSVDIEVEKVRRLPHMTFAVLHCTSCTFCLLYIHRCSTFLGSRGIHQSSTCLFFCMLSSSRVQYAAKRHATPCLPVHSSTLSPRCRMPFAPPHSL
jgi:hypothetical protein